MHTTRVLSVSVGMLLAVLPLVARPGRTEGGKIRLVTTEIVLATWPADFDEDVDDMMFVVSPDGNRVAYQVPRGDGWAVGVNGEEGPTYGGVDTRDTLAFSPNSKRVAYVGWRKGQAYVVVDGIEGKGYDQVGPLEFSPDSRHLAFCAARGGRAFLVVDGVEREAKTVEGESPIFSPDSRRVIYAVQRGDKWSTIVADGAEEKEYDGAVGRSLVFSPDGQHVAYAAKRGDKEFVVLDGAQQKPYDEVSYLAFSPDGKRLAYQAYRAGRSGRWVVVIDGSEGTQYEGRPGTPVFSPDGKRVAFVASRQGKDLAVVDGVEGKEYDEVGGLTFSPDSQHLAYVAERDGKRVVVLDGVEGEPCEETWPQPHFSPDSKHLAHKGRRDGESFVVVDGVRGKGYGADSYVVVVDGVEETREYPIFIYGGPEFSPDSRHVAYLAGNFAGCRVVVDEVEGEEYDSSMLILNGVFFDGPKSLHFLTRRDNRVLRVQVEIVEE